MTLNRRSIKWLPKVSLVIGLSLLGMMVAVEATSGSPEIGMFNSLQAVNNIKLLLVNLFL